MSLHIDLTPDGLNKFLGLALAAGLALAFAPWAAAQDAAQDAAQTAAQTIDLSEYQGPGILSPGVGDIGTRSGQPVELRYYAGVAGFYDSNPQSVSVDSKGNLLRIPDLYGVGLQFGAYGSHNFRHAQLSLDYRGDYQHTTLAGYDSSDHSLTLGYTHQASRRLVFDLRQAIGTLKYGYGTVAAGATSDSTGALNASSLFFDTRTYYAQSTESMTFLQSAKTSYTISGTGFVQDYSTGAGLANTWGYTLSGSVNRRLSKNFTVGGLYQHSYFESPSFGSQSTSDAYFGTLTAVLGRFWTLSLQAGAANVQVQSPFSVTLSPLLAAVLGQNTLTGTSYYHTIYPNGSADLRRQFQRAVVNFHYDRKISAGNGTFSTARAEDFYAGYSYTGFRRFSLSVSGGYNALVALGEASYKFEQYNGGGGVTYSLGHNLDLSARFDVREQQITSSSYSVHGTRTTVGLLFSPGRFLCPCGEEKARNPWALLACSSWMTRLRWRTC